MEKTVTTHGMAGWSSDPKKVNVNQSSYLVTTVKHRIQKFLFHLTSVMTALSPRRGAGFLNFTVQTVLGNRYLARTVHQKNLKTAKKISDINRILVVPDIHIGDAVMMQGAVQAFRDLFPEARIDYVIKKSVLPLIEGNPAISHVYPFFTGTAFPTMGDIECIQKLTQENQYDLCFNASPFFEDESLFPRGQKLLNFMTVAPQLVRNEIDQTGVNHFLFQSYEFVRKLFDAGHDAARPFHGAPVTLSDEAFENAEDFLIEKGILRNKPIIFLNPDTASPFTLIPFDFQVKMLKTFARWDCTLLLGTAFTHQGIEKKLMEALTAGERRKVALVPASLPIDAYTALLDFATVFISGDTGPLHMAAARKVSRSGNICFRNKTFVVSIFGATPARMSGYDSTNPLFPPANQDAPSRTYVSQSPCRNITCVNKMLKTCKTVRCFEVLDLEEIESDIKAYLKTLGSFSGGLLLLSRAELTRDCVH